MIKAKRYFLCVLMVNSFCLLAMDLSQGEQISLYVEGIRNRIDEDLLGINKNLWFRGIIGSVFSYYHASGLTKQQAAQQMSTIDSYIVLDKERVLKKLAKRHWYVNYLMDNLVQAKVQKIRRVTGSTIDKLCNPVGQNNVKKIVHNKALKMFFAESGIKDLLQYIPMNTIHFTVLYGHESEINPDSLTMSADGKYLQSTDCSNNRIIWDMKQGVMVNDLFDNKIQWKSKYVSLLLGKYVMDLTDTYCAISGNSEIQLGENFSHLSVFHIKSSFPGSQAPLIKRSTPAIILFKRPEENSYFCDQAFNNSFYNRKELTALFTSESFKKNEGFPQNNLKIRLEKRFISDEWLAYEKNNQQNKSSHSV